MPLTPRELQDASRALHESNRDLRQARSQLDFLEREFKRDRISLDQLRSLRGELNSIRRPDAQIRGRIQTLSRAIDEKIRELEAAEETRRRMAAQSQHRPAAAAKGGRDDNEPPRQRVAI